MTEITLTHGDAQATIVLLGAEARTWRVAGRDLLWPGDPAIWSDISPILYPVVGWTRDSEERVDGVRYPLGLHGFARFETFAVETSGPDFARLTLSDNSSTRAIYPFAFALAIEYRLSADALAIAIEVANPGERRAPYACGLHPGFRWPLGSAGREGALVQFEKAERPEVPELAPGGLIRSTTRPVPLCGRNLPLSDALFERTRFASSIVRASRWRLSTPRGLRSRWNMRAFGTSGCGRGPVRRSSVSNHGPATAIPTVLPAICSRSPACGCSNRESRPGMKRASSSDRSKA